MTTTSVSDPLVGRVLDGRYEILAKVARGGMATVYRAQDQRLTRTVAVKVMHDGLGDDAEFARKFDREARAAAKLSNQHVVSVFDQGVDSGRPYIVMEYIEGGTLRHLITREAPLEPLRVLDLMEPVVHALASAHEAGLVHRDVKPENVLISNRGQIKVGDFGLARAVTAQTATATQGLLIGTVSYLPPELVTSGKANARSDVYSTGILLFEMLTGKKPHTGDTPIQVAWSHVHNDVPAPSTLVHADGGWKQDSRRIIPPYLDALIVACTRRQPSERPENARVLLELLRRCRTALGHGIIDDPALTTQMRRALQPETGHRSVGSGAAAKLATGGGGSAQTSAAAATLTEPPKPVSFRASSTSSPGSSISARTDRVKLRVDDQGAPELRMRAKTPVSPVDREAVASNRFTKTVGAGRPGQAASVEAAGATSASSPRSWRHVSVSDDARLAARPRPRSQATPLFPQVSQDPVHRRRRGLVALVLVLVLTLVAGLASYWYFAEGRWTSAPSVELQTREQAEAVATQNGFSIAFTEQYSETVPKGTVISAHPGGGDRVLKGSHVEAIVSRGPERYSMPTVVGSPLPAAREAIGNAHLKVGTVTEQYHEQAPANQVLSASQKAGSALKPNTAVDLVVSKGPKPITIPSVVGKSQDQATKQLTGLGFKVTASQAHHDSVAAGQVISQTPAKGTGKAGDSVALVVSKGPVMVAVPGVGGKSEASAKERLTRAGFKVKVVYNTPAWVRLDIVAAQDPGNTKSAPKGSTVTIYVS